VVAGAAAQVENGLPGPEVESGQQVGPAGLHVGGVLYAIQEPETPAESNVFQINAIRSYFHGLATPPRPLGPPWPRQIDWRAYLRDK
jgi:hypothetical protein